MGIVGKHHVGGGHADLHDGAGEVAGEEACSSTSGLPTASMHTSAPKPSVRLADGLDRVDRARR